MGTLFNRPEQKSFRQYLRTHCTRAEQVLWLSLKHRQVLGCKFRRQHGVGKYVLDFFCPELLLAIEVDGASHESREKRAHDEQRQAEMEQKGIRFLRFTDDQVLSNCDEVVKAIETEIRKRKSAEPLPSST